jgi:proline iminopeptidase
VRVDDGSLYSVRDGHGEALLCLHGGPGAGHAYLRRGLLPLASELSLISFDQRSVRRPGHQAPRMSLDTHLADIDRVLDAHGVKTCFLLGHSWGAVLAMLYVARAPERVKGVVLVNLVSVDPVERWDFAQRVGQKLESDAFVAYLGAKKEELAQLADNERVRRLAFIEAHWPLFERPDALEQMPQYGMAAELRDHLWEEAAQSVRALADGAHVCPTLVVQGEQDPTPLTVAARVARPLGPVTTATLPRCGHVAPLEAPAALQQTVAAFVAESTFVKPTLSARYAASSV